LQPIQISQQTALGGNIEKIVGGEKCIGGPSTSAGEVREEAPEPRGGTPEPGDGLRG